jgi:hypothetical protein
MALPIMELSNVVDVRSLNGNNALDHKTARGARVVDQTSKE